MKARRLRISDRRLKYEVYLKRGDIDSGFRANQEAAGGGNTAGEGGAERIGAAHSAGADLRQGARVRESVYGERDGGELGDDYAGIGGGIS